MQIVAISDLHISDAQDPLYARLLKVLSPAQWAKDDVLILLGDIFDLYVGHLKAFETRYSEFHATLQTLLSQGVEIHYVQGNHDFFLEKTFAPHPSGNRVHIHDSHTELSREGKSFHFAHGDLVNPGDYGYRALRTFFRSIPMRLFVTQGPERWVMGFGEFSSRKSAGHTPRLPSAERLSQLRAHYHRAARELWDQGANFVVMGHCHDLDEKIEKPGSRAYWNIGFPRTHGSYLRWRSGEAGFERVPLG